MLRSLALTLLVSSALVAQQKPDSLTIAADQGRIAGSAATTVWLLEVSDFQCPWCKRWHDETYAAIRREYVDNGKIRLAYLNFPIPGHLNAWPAAIAAMCASTQGKFWPTHDRIFDTQDKWKALPSPRQYFDSLAVAAGANATKQQACSKSDRMRPLIEADQARARAAGVKSTPTFFVGDKMLEGAMPIDSFRKYINQALAAKK